MSEQTVDTTDTEVQSDEDNVAQDSLDNLLNDYDEAVKPVQATEQPEDVVAFLKEERAERQREREERERTKTKEDISNAVKSIKESIEMNLPDRLVRGALLDKAETDGRFLQAWRQRESNPGKFNKILKALAKEIKDELPDLSATSDKNDVVAAVKSATTKKGEPETPNFSSMSNGEFHIYKQKLARGG